MTVDFLAFCTGGGANVISQAAYASDPDLSIGWQDGDPAYSNKLNKVWRQSSFVAAAIATLVSNRLSEDVLDNGDLSGFVSQLDAAFASSGLPSIADDSFLANTSGSAAVPVATSLSAFIDYALGSTRGAVIYRGASGWAILAPGTSGYFLSSGGAGADPSWANPSAGGTVTSVATGSGLTGGPISTTGTISFAAIANGLVLANISGSSAAPSAHSVSDILDAVFSASRGTILFRGNSGWSALGPSTSGLFLQTNGASADPSWGSPAGGGTVLSVATGAGLTGGPITATGTIAESHLVNAQIGTSYVIDPTDQAKLITFSNTSPVAVALPQAGSGGNYQSGWDTTALNLNTGAVTITPATSTINGAATLVLKQGQSARIFSDGTNYWATANAAGVLLAANNLSDVSNTLTSRSNLGAAASGANSDITSLAGLTTKITIAQGGTGAGTASAARTALGAAASGANADITSLAGLTTPLTTAQGGTGSNSGNVNLFTIPFVIGVIGTALTTGIKGWLEVPCNCTIVRSTLVSDQTGSVVVNIWKVPFASFPPTASNKITSTHPPTISAARSAQDTTLTGWTTSLSKGDILAFNVDSVTSINQVMLSLGVVRT